MVEESGMSTRRVGCLPASWCQVVADLLEPCMATAPPRTERRRARPGSIRRPVNGRLYRGTWLLVGRPLLVAALSVARPTTPPRALSQEFDGATTKQLADDLSSLHANRFPGALGPVD